MQRIGVLEGRGQVEVSGDPAGVVDYTITIWREPGGMKSADGAASERSGNPLAKAFNAGTAILHLDNGGTVKFAVTLLNGEHAQIQISGPVPGF
jgi:hypothetical protein